LTDSIGTDVEARSTRQVTLADERARWVITQRLSE